MQVWRPTCSPTVPKDRTFALFGEGNQRTETATSRTKAPPDAELHLSALALPLSRIPKFQSVYHTETFDVNTELDVC